MPKKHQQKVACTRLEYLEDALRQYEDLADEARGRGSYVASVQAKRQAVQIRGEIDQAREVARLSVQPASVEAHRGEVLSEVRRLRQGATEAGSYVAAARLLSLERELLVADETDRRAADAGRLTGASEADLEAEIEALRLAREAGADPAASGLRVLR